MAAKNIFTKFDREFDIKGLKEELVSVGTGEGLFRDVPSGVYEIKLEKMECVESKSGKPMLTCWMKILSGEFKNSRLFMNQVLNTAFGLHNANEFLRSLQSGIEVEFQGYSNYHGMVLDIHEAINGKYEYYVEYGETSRGFKTFKITEVLEV